MADTPISHPNLSLMTFSGNDPNQNATAFWNSVENKILFSLGQRPADNDARRSYDSRQRSLFGSLLTDTSLEWFNDNVTNATTWAQLKDLFLNRFTDGRDQFKHRIDAENAARQDGELIKNYFHRIKSSVDRGWPESIDEAVHATEAAQNAERTIQNRQRSQKYIDFSIKGLRPLALKQKAHEYMIEHPNANWDQFTNHVITKDLTFIVATDPANKSTTDKMTSLETQIKELTKLIKNQEVSAINDHNSFQRRHPDIKGRPNSTRFCEYCRMNGHSISRCSKKQVQDEVNKLRKELTTKNERRVSFETDYKRNRRPNNFPNQSNPNPSNRFWDNQNRTQILAKITMAFAIIIITTETISKRLIHNRLSITKDPKPMMIGTPEKTNSEKMNKLLNSSTTKKIGNSTVTLEVDHITLEAIIAITVETQRDLNHQILDRIKYSLKLPTGLRKKSITVMLSLISFL